MPISRIKTDGIQDDAITSAKIGVDVIVADDLAANSVTVSEITDGAVTGAKLANNLNYDSGTLYLDSTNNRVGIGTTSGVAKLEIKNTVSTTGNMTDSALHLTTDAVTGRKLNIGFGLGGGVANTNAAVIGFDVTSGTGATEGDLFFSTRNGTLDDVPTERMRITSAGNVGIGTSSPSAKLQSNTLTGTNAILAVGADTDGYADVEIKSTGSSGASRLYFSDTAAKSGLLRYSHNTDSMEFTTNNTEKVRIDSTGRLLVGVTVHSVSSSQRFEVQGGVSLFQVNSSSVAPIIVKNTDQTAAPGSPQIIIQDGGGNRGAIYRDSSNLLGIHGQGGITFHSGSTAPTTERMLIDSSGNVGIGTSTPQEKIHSMTGGSNALRVSGNANNNQKVEIGYDTTNGPYIKAGSSGETGLQFYVDNTSLAAILDSQGRFLLGRNSTVGYKLDIYGDVKVERPGTSATHVVFTNANGNVGTIRTSGTSTSYNTSSDYRLKENVTTDWDATTRLKQLNPVRFNFIADADTKVDGFLAHEVQSVVPEAISGTHNEVDDEGNPVYQGIDQSKLVPLLVKTIQELEARITALESN